MIEIKEECTGTSTDLDTLNKIKELSKPLTDFLKSNYDSYVHIIVSVDSIRITQDIAGIPVK